MDRIKLNENQKKNYNNIEQFLKELFSIDINKEITINKKKFEENRNDKDFRKKLKLLREKLLERKIVNKNFQEMIFEMKEDKKNYNKEELNHLLNFQISITKLAEEIYQFIDINKNDLLVDSKDELNSRFIKFLEFLKIFKNKFVI